MRAADAAALGAVPELSLGCAVPTWIGALTEAPAQATVRVYAVSDRSAPMFGPMTARSTLTLDACACAELPGICVVLSSAKAQMPDPDPDLDLDLDLNRLLASHPRR